MEYRTMVTQQHCIASSCRGSFQVEHSSGKLTVREHLKGKTSDIPFSADAIHMAVSDNGRYVAVITGNSLKEELYLFVREGDAWKESHYTLSPGSSRLYWDESMPPRIVIENGMSRPRMFFLWSDGWHSAS